MRDYFCGWYFKCQSEKETLAVIPAFHKSRGEKSCSIQIITDEGAYNVPFAYESFEKTGKGFDANIDKNRFSKEGIELNIDTPELNVSGSVRFGELCPISYDIMGPFCFVPFMECRHSVFSMMHTVNGCIKINDKEYIFDDSKCYIEGDRGYSFPSEYLWTHCFFENASVMLSVAKIPLGVVNFTGIIGVIRWQDKEYRIATYLGAKVTKIENGEVEIKQGKLALRVKLLKKNARPLLAPNKGNMTRTIHESTACRASYELKKGEKTLFSFESDRASFEYEYPQYTQSS